MKSSVRIEESKGTKFSNLMQVLWTKITAAPTTRGKAEGSKQYEKKNQPIDDRPWQFILNFDNCTAGVKRVARSWQQRSFLPSPTRPGIFGNSKYCLFGGIGALKSLCCGSPKRSPIQQSRRGRSLF